MPSSLAALLHGTLMRRRDVAGALALLLRQVRGGEDLAGELVGRAHVDQVLDADRGDDLVAERADRQVGVLRRVRWRPGG